MSTLREMAQFADIFAIYKKREVKLVSTNRGEKKKVDRRRRC